MEKKPLLGLVLSSLIVIGGLTYADNDLIVHDTTGGTITVYSSDKSYGITIADKNLGATSVGTGSSSYGSYYKWGNDSVYAGGADSTYESDDNAWGGGNDNENSTNIVKGYDKEKHIVTNSGDRRGPCNSGYHVPSAGEWYELMMLWCNANSGTCTSSVIKDYDNNEQQRAKRLETTEISTNFSNDLKLPLAGRRSYSNGNVIYFGDSGGANYWSSSPRGESNPSSAWYLYFNSSSVNPANVGSRAGGDSVRCFKNSYIKPPQSFTLTFDAVTNGGTATTGSVEVDGSVDLSGYVAIKTGWDFLGWNTNSGATAPISTSYNAYTITENTTVYAIFKKDLKVTYLSGVGVSSIGADSGSCTIYNTGTQCTVTAPDITLKSGYGTGIWSTGSVNVNTGADITLTADDTYTANATPNTYIVKFNAGEGAGTMEDQTFTYDVAQNLTGNTFTRDGYTFSGWTDGITAYTDKQNVVNLATSGTITLTAQWKQNTPSGGSSSGGGSSGGGSRRATTTDDSKITPGTTANNDTSKDNSSVDSQNNNTQGKIYSEEFQKAYEFAYKNGITTMDTIEKAEMDKPLTRIAMAKMLSYYAINVLGKKPANIVVPKFSDVTDKMDEEYDNGVTLAYQLGIMGINMPNNKFRPNDLVTRAEFVTALSRMLFGIEDGKDKYYSTHLAKLMEEKIITNDNPNLQELRGYVMIMLMRSAE